MADFEQFPQTETPIKSTEIPEESLELDQEKLMATLKQALETIIDLPNIDISPTTTELQRTEVQISEAIKK